MSSNYYTNEVMTVFKDIFARSRTVDQKYMGREDIRVYSGNKAVHEFCTSNVL